MLLFWIIRLVVVIKIVEWIRETEATYTTTVTITSKEIQDWLIEYVNEETIVSWTTEYLPHATKLVGGERVSPQKKEDLIFFNIAATLKRSEQSPKADVTFDADKNTATIRLEIKEIEICTELNSIDVRLPGFTKNFKPGKICFRPKEKKGKKEILHVEAQVAPVPHRGGSYTLDVTSCQYEMPMDPHLDGEIAKSLFAKAGILGVKAFASGKTLNTWLKDTTEKTWKETWEHPDPSCNTKITGITTKPNGFQFDLSSTAEFPKEFGGLAGLQTRLCLNPAEAKKRAASHSQA